MNGGKMYIRGDIEEWKLGREVKITDLDEEEQEELQQLINEYANDFNLDLSHVKPTDFKKLYPGSKRPYGNLYAY